MTTTAKKMMWRVIAFGGVVDMQCPDRPTAEQLIEKYNQTGPVSLYKRMNNKNGPTWKRVTK